MMETICGDDLLPGSVQAEPSESNGADVQTPPESQKSMAFTIHFADSKGNASARNLRENLGRFPFRHTRNWSLSAVGEDKKNVNESALQAIGLSPLPTRKLVLTRRAGYHSEGYFSSDQEEDMRSKSDIFVQKLKTAERGIRTTNLAQEKKILAEHSSQIKAKLMSACEKQQIEKFFERDQLLSDEVKEKRHNTSLNNVASPFEDIDANCKEEWLVASTTDDNDIEIRVQTQNPDEMIDDIEEVINDSSNDTVSEAGTYTIERDVPCPEEDEARKELENVIGFMKSAQEKDIDQTEEQKGNGFKMSLYRDNPNWINEWANQVAKHNHESEYEKSDPMSLPPLPLGKPVLSSKGLPPSGRKLTPSPQHTRNHLFQSPVAISGFQDFGQKQDAVGSERHSDSSLETESFLRATESVVTAMQARMTLSVDSGGESDVDTSHSYSRTIVGDRGPVTPFRRASNASDTSVRQGEGRQSDSSSETGEGRMRSGTIPAPGSTPQMRYNRAFSLRRARLDNEPEPAESKKNKSLSKADSPTPINSRSKKMTEPPKPAQSRLKSKSTKPETTALSRTESARASMRAQRQTPQPSSRPGLPKKEVKKSGGGRSNSTLSSREVEFQNWKRRKSYDPMKAAAEGKKKEAAKKALPLSTSMTQSCIPDVETSPSWVPELPCFMLEPLDSHVKNSGPPSNEFSSLESTESPESYRVTRLRNDSYLGAIHKENLLVRAGLQNLLQLFITHAANVFTLELSPDYPLLLEEQVDTCKRVLNIYRYMVMHTRMEARTWEQLLVVLLQITSLILSKTPPKHKEETLGGKLAPAIFQTLIVTWIKANLNVVISADLWDQFLAVLSSLTQWEELIREWAKTLETLTRVLARHVYGLDLTDLPLDRLTEQKAKKRRGNRQQSVCESNQNQGHPAHPASQPPRNSVSYSSGQGSMRASSIPPLVTSSTPCHDQSSSDGPASFNTTASELSTGTFQQHHHPHSHHHHHHGMPGSSPDKRRSGYHGLNLRSLSEGNLSTAVTHRHRHKGSRMADSGRHCGSRAAPVVIPVLPLCVEREVARIIAHSADTNYSQRTCPKTRIHKSRSMDSLRSARAGTPFQYSESEGPTRSPSPAPSSGVESNSIKDSPMQIDVISADGTSLDLQETSGRTSVMAGGTVRGWLPDVAVVLWRRMLGALGDVNQITSPVLHAQVFDYLVELSDTLIKIRMNQGVSVDGLCTPPPPDLIPPLKIIAPWCFKALSLPANYARGKLSALRLLCQMTMTHQDIPAPHDHVTHFYKVLHHGLIGTEQAVVNTIVQYCGPRFFSLMLPGYSLLMYDFIHAANTVLSSNDIATAPRTEAASILGTLLCLSNTFPELPVLQPTVKEFSVRSCVDAKDHIVPILLRCGKREPTGLARCIALSSLGIYVYQELSHGTCHPRIKDAVNVLLLALRFNNKTVALVASDVLVALSDHAARLLEVFPEIPLRIIEVLALTLSQLAPRQQNKESLSGSSCVLLTSLMFCLGEWCMCVPIPQLVAHGRNCLLLTVFKVLSQLQSGNSHTAESETQPIPESADYDLDIKLDNLREESAPPHIPQESAPSSSAEQPIQLAAKMVLMHLVNHLGHFPMGIGAARLSSMVVEQDDVPGLSADELSAEVFSAPNIQLFVLSSRLLVSLVELPTLDVPGGGVTAGLRTALSQVRVILRDLAGKASWDASILYCSPDYERTAEFSIVEQGNESGAQWGNSVHPEMLSSLVISSPPQHTLRHRPPHQLPTWEDGADDMDNLDDLLQYIGHTSPECLESLDTPRNIPATPPPQFTRELEEESMTSVLGQRNIEKDFLQRPLISLGSEPCAAAVHYPTTAPFQHCRLLFSQLGLAGWERRSQLQLLAKNEKLLRELRNLDTQRCRETHKIAVIYVAEGQEDKNSILSNTCGSQAYEEFISGLAWEVELESHTGFLGGLQRNRSTGETAPYYATSFLEAIFHVATRMPSSSQESLLQKMRHLGNDEVHIVWSEHSRDYRRGIIPTEFCDVLIVIYPLLNGLYRVQVKRKPDVPYFGPLFNEAIVDSKVLPGLVRASAISASRAKRSMLPFYQNYYEERSRSLETVVCNHREPTTFEEFAAQVYSPVQTPSPFCGGPTRSSGTSLSSRSPEPSCSSAPSSTLAAALLDSHHHCSGSPSDSRIRGAESIRVWFAGNEVASAADSGLHGISPRPLKKLSFKTTARKSLAVRCESVSLTPPDSPTTRKSK